MQLPQEHPKHTHDVLKSASISWYNHCCYIFDFLFTCHKKCQQPKLPIRDRQLAARSAPQDLALCNSPPCPTPSQPPAPLSTTSHRPLAPLSPHLHLENTLTLLLIPRHPSYAHSSESFWSHFYYISLELLLPSSP